MSAMSSFSLKRISLVGIIDILLRTPTLSNFLLVFVKNRVTNLNSKIQSIQSDLLVFAGDRVFLPSLKHIGKCITLEEPPTSYSSDVRNQINGFKRAVGSVLVPPKMCIRLHEGNCTKRNERTLDLLPHLSHGANLFDVHGFKTQTPFGNVVNALEVISCPKLSGITLYSEKHFKGMGAFINTI